MSYIKNVWNSNDLVTAAKMNHIEDGIESMLTRAWEIIIATNQWSFDEQLNRYKYIASLEDISAATWIDINLGESNSNLASQLYWETSDDSVIFSTEAIPTDTITVTVAAWGTAEGASDDSGIIKAEGIYPVYTGTLANLNKNCIVCASGSSDLPTSLIDATSMTVITQHKSDTERAQIAFAYGAEKVVMRVMSNGTYGDWFVLGAKNILTTDNIANNLTTAAEGSVLDARQGKALKDTIDSMQVTPLVLSIPTSQWSGSGSDYYIEVTASNVTANSILVPDYDSTSAANLNGPVWCVPAAGSFTIHTTAVPSGTVNILVQFPGVMGEANYQVLADVYSKSQTYSKSEAVAKADIVNNLTNTATDKPLSANMGKHIKDTLGTIINGDSNTSNISVQSGTETLISSITLTEGKWILVACCDWQPNANGYRQIAWLEGLNSNRALANTTAPMSNAKETYQQHIRYLSTTGETLNLYALQNSGSTINAYPHVFAIKINV